MTEDVYELIVARPADENERTITVLRIDHRGDIYRAPGGFA